MTLLHCNPKQNLTTTKTNTPVKMKPNQCQFITRDFLVHPTRSDAESEEWNMSSVYPLMEFGMGYCNFFHKIVCVNL